MRVLVEVSCICNELRKGDTLEDVLRGRLKATLLHSDEDEEPHAEIFIEEDEQHFCPTTEVPTAECSDRMNVDAIGIHFTDNNSI